MIFYRFFHYLLIPHVSWVLEGMLTCIRYWYCSSVVLQNSTKVYSRPLNAYNWGMYASRYSKTYNSSCDACLHICASNRYPPLMLCFGCDLSWFVAYPRYFVCTSSRIPSCMYSWCWLVLLEGLIGWCWSLCDSVIAIKRHTVLFIHFHSTNKRDISHCTDSAVATQVSRPGETPQSTMLSL
jgi:hypothetical protein